MKDAPDTGKSADAIDTSTKVSQRLAPSFFHSHPLVLIFVSTLLRQLEYICALLRLPPATMVWVQP